jgi:hypothetical protein
MEVVLNIIAGLAFAAASGFAGYRSGVFLRARPAWQYWAANVAVVLLGTALIALGYVTPLDVFKWAGLASIAGGLTGLKYGLARVVGQWRTADAVEAPHEDRERWRPSGKPPVEPR